ncbi:MAG: ergothioneine biosynthesis protein EgtC [Symploca sp. SIO2G7]|nr:ergothioneine biosynthesis protein EgtC [Symploca sp. SIO2G7]
MCRLLAYMGTSVQPGTLIYEPDHSLEVQSYRPKETITTSVNADGVGMGWYEACKRPNPFIYKNMLPIWADINLPHLAYYVDTNCFMAYVRSATPGQASNLSNCQPFSHNRLLFTHNGFIENFRDTLYQPIRQLLTGEVYRAVEGTTDSEHIFALIVNEITVNGSSLKTALVSSLQMLRQLAAKHAIAFSANIVVSDGNQLVASRLARGITAPSLYWLSQKSGPQGSTIIASEPLFSGEWQPFAEDTMLTVDHNSYPKLDAIMP